MMEDNVSDCAESQEDFPLHLEESIKSIIKKEGFIKHQVTRNLLPTEGGSFLGRLYTVTVQGTTREGDKQTDIFIKHILSCEKLKSTFDVHHAYETELYVYKELSKIFTDLQNDAGITVEDRFKMVKSYDESSLKAIILENVSLKGYKTCSRTYVASLEDAEFSMKQLAKFHGLSFVLGERRPDYFSRNIKVNQGPFIFNETFAHSARNIAEIAIKYIKEESRQRMETFLKCFMTKWKRYALDTTKTKCCLCHGDFRLNNILMQHEDNRLKDVILIDYQLSCYGCPIDDLLHFIFTGTDQEFRRKHLTHLKDLYYASLGEFLGKFNLDCEKVYPRDEFEKDFKERLDLGLIYALYFLPFFLAAEGEIPDLAETSIADMDFKVLEDLPLRMQGIVDDFVSWGYL
ncbi:uncharacterized protein LOC126373156 [Pectinophora gossypiella]|uniref:uncharacterized protein LOC126373156 n=1 Tax=Pectinophora gossypiella TaxID=13191 RepID=UPI00214E47F8|nr:uncharacterized protein LOC126373156 [Pectinophora gossypiella]